MLVDIKAYIVFMNLLIFNFFYNSESVLDYVLKPLQHIRSNWDVIWDYDNDRYIEEQSFGAEVNELINELSIVDAPKK